MEITSYAINDKYYRMKINDYFYVKKINNDIFVISNQDKSNFNFMLNGEAFFSYLKISFYYNNTQKIFFQHPCGQLYVGCQCEGKSFCYLLFSNIQKEQIYRVEIKNVNKITHDLADFFEIKIEKNISLYFDNIETIDAEDI
jgi:hypothetical protein